ncbi:MAG: M28 family peptidase [Paludibacteraceae bacterium]|nr:M28 family peptidase [Paludibacteraceae bacterium]NLK92262.1 M28 family peptidase [Bacteroidales bacterium]MBP7218899.1 M28 family peptidase [Paludibacteraceae bacterium]MBP8627555.1 M28 family peptidase [Paludibacteraceae bacterium]MBP9648325.1 M28 family peptidase [Paludibacteraceae bacterium]
MKSVVYLALFSLLLFVSCQSNEQSTSSQKQETQDLIQNPFYNADSAYVFVANQVAFGPRVPNTDAHKKCGDYMVATLQRFGAEVTEQRVQLKAYNNTILDARNIIGSFNPEQKTRIFLCAHWDSRPYSDNDTDSANYHTPVQGANDGASGVGVLLELARLMQQVPPTIGVDIILFDAEDYGRPSFDKSADIGDSFCLGSQYWSRNPHKEGYKPKYGILLDMVGGKNPTFLQEYFSMLYAPDVVKMVWKKAHQLGYQDYFISQPGNPVIDDHYYINKIANIPCIDIIHYSNQTGFVDTWHTIYDTMENIDKTTLGVVGRVVTAVVYSEK